MLACSNAVRNGYQHLLYKLDFYLTQLRIQDSRFKNLIQGQGSEDLEVRIRIRSRIRTNKLRIQIRIQEAQKYADPTDPDPVPEHCFLHI
jgi:hypothetical protein